ncbi:AAA family ATPase [Aeromonas sp. 2MA4]|uniref:AAA family ATPase n=1 Tax=Aeromonas sp. 2MA4 TaxID=2699195 RepID=UPI0023DD9FFB|nr:AAA family ATPase [Aeromonas sp. 2MA4]MDF2393489.1 AAA family ATPase [Aeromonas sp. 2MA4]
MKIAALTIAGFKGIEKKASIPLAPITLLFGANSTGKSTVLHALLYLYEIIVERNFDPQYSSITGEQLWLGGFHNMVHGKNLANTITLGATLDFLDGNEDVWDDYLTGAESFLLINSLGFWPEAIADVMSFELDLAWDQFNQRVFVSRFECSSKAHSYIKFEAQEGKRSASITHFSPLSHWYIPEPFENLDIFSPALWEGLYLPYQDALPPIESRIDISDNNIDWESEYPELPLEASLFAAAALSQASLAPLKILSRKLQNLLHVGPLRIVPGRETFLEAKTKTSRWYDGTAGWDHFAFGSDAYQEQVNYCFNHADRLHSSYRFTTSIHGEAPLQQRQVQLIEANTNTPLRPCDVGVGVLQVFPFIAATSLEQAGVIVSFEQPELHIHPRWQLSLADMMLTACRKDPERMFLVETHSEHLMLRLLKRVSSPDIDYQTVSPEMISVINVYKHDGNLFYQRQNITENGDFELDWPLGFFEERYGEV